MIIAGKTDVGKQREMNQDFIKFHKFDEETALLIVCDGMGGASGGDIASNEAVEEISKVMSSINESMSKENILELMNKAVQAANTVVFNKSQSDESLHGNLRKTVKQNE